MTKKEKEEYLDSWSLGVFVVSTCETGEKLINELLDDHETIYGTSTPPVLEIYRRLSEPWGLADALLSAFGI